MKRIELPDIVEAAKKRPLSYNPASNEFIYYDKVEQGIQKIFPIDRLNHDQLLKLAVERQLSDQTSTTATLNGQLFSNEQIAEEMKSQTKIGKQIFNSDINYLRFFLSQFPKECFEQ